MLLNMREYALNNIRFVINVRLRDRTGTVKDLEAMERLMNNRTTEINKDTRYIERRGHYLFDRRE